MKTALRASLAFIGGFVLVFPLATLFDAINGPLFHTWGLMHGSLLFAWPILGVVVFFALGQVSWFKDIGHTRKPTVHVATFPRAVQEAHAHSSAHRSELLAGNLCGCFYCLEIYPPTEITEWTDEEQTALCARCWIDSVIGDRSGYPLTAEFLAEMKRRWF